MVHRDQVEHQEYQVTFQGPQVHLEYHILQVLQVVHLVHQVHLVSQVPAVLLVPTLLSPIVSSTFSFDDDSTADTIAQDDDIIIYTTGGCGPFSWTVSGSGFSLENNETEGNNNTLYASESSGGCATITVTDESGQEISIGIRSTNGAWTSSGVYQVCEIQAPGTEYGTYPDGKKYQLISGCIKEVQWTLHNVKSTVPCADLSDYWLEKCYSGNGASCSAGGVNNCIDPRGYAMCVCYDYIGCFAVDSFVVYHWE